MLDKLTEQGWNILALHHAEAILTGDLDGALEELESVCLGICLPLDEIVKGGGGEGKLTQRMRSTLSRKGWKKHNFHIKRVVDDEETASSSHEVDHVKKFGNHAIALEIEWNNKDPFFDRDLENFQRLHSVGAISVGVIVTRGDSLQACFIPRLVEFANSHGVSDAEKLRHYYTPTPRQVASFSTRMKGGICFEEAWAKLFVADKFGEATTHWRKLEDRVKRGVGNPCPLLLLGIPGSVVQVPPIEIKS